MNYNLRALQIFECVSRHKSISAAAGELNISASAISHQLKKLGEQVGENLFIKAGKRMVLSPSGARLANSLTLAFDQIDESVSSCIGHDNETIRLAMCSTFGAGWFIKRLGNFLSKNDSISVQLMMYGDDPVRVAAAADAFVTILPPGDGYWSLHLFNEQLTAVSRDSILSSTDLSEATLITTHMDRTALGADWKEYLQCIGVNYAPRREQIMTVSHEIFALEAVKQGIGIALLPTFLAEEAIVNGLISPWHDALMPSGRSYSFCTKTSRRHTKTLDMLTKWLYVEKTAGDQHRPAQVTQMNRPN